MQHQNQGAPQFNLPPGQLQIRPEAPSQNPWRGQMPVSAPPNMLPPHLVNIPFPGPGPEHESTVADIWKEKVALLTNPKPLFHISLLDGLQDKSVGFLCEIGKEVIQELLVRIGHLASIFHKNDRYKNHVYDDIEIIITYCKHLLQKLWEIRVFIDRKMIAVPRLKPDEFVELMALPMPAKVPQKLADLRAEYDGNQKYLVQMSSNLKKIEWMAENSDPRHLGNEINIRIATLSEEQRRKSAGR